MRIFWFAAALLLFPCWAFGAEDAPEQDGKDVPVFEEVVVTSTKREEPIQEVPASISSVSGAEVEEMNAWDLGEAVRVMPNVHMKEATSGSSIVIRGLSTIDTSLYNSAGLYVDDVAHPLTYMQNLQLFDVERIEVLRGQQGTLYGRNSDSGVVNVVLRQPGPDIRANAFADYGSYNSLRAGAGFSGPLIKDTLFLSGSFLNSDTDGFIRNITTDNDRAANSDMLSGRGVLRWTPNSDLDMTLTTESDSTEGGFGKLRYSTGAGASGRYNVRSNADGGFHDNSLGQSLKVKYDLGGAEVTSVSNFRDYNYGFRSDLDRTAANMGYSDMGLHQNSWSQEFRLASTDKERFTWLAGLYAGRDDTASDFDRVRALGNTYLDTSVTETSSAVFGQGTYAILEDLRLTLGLRGELSQASGDQTYRATGVYNTYGKDLDESVLLPTATLAYDITGTVTAYATVSRGFLAGGYNYSSSTSEDTFTYNPEYTTNYELGLESAWFENRLTANFAVFYTQVEDKQVRQEDPTGGVGAWTFANADEAHIQGLELEMLARPIQEVELSAGLGYAQSEVDKWTATVSGAPYDYKGKHLPWAPELTWNLGGGYYHPSGFFGRVDVLGTGEHVLRRREHPVPGGLRNGQSQAGLRPGPVGVLRVEQEPLRRGLHHQAGQGRFRQHHGRGWRSANLWRHRGLEFLMDAAHAQTLGESGFGVIADWLPGPVRMAVLEAALELGIADLLAETDDPAEVARRLGAHPGNTLLFLDGLAAMGLAEKQNGRFSNTALAENHLRRSRDTYLGGMIGNLKRLQFRNLGRLADLVRQGSPELRKEERLGEEEHWRSAASNLACYQRSGPARMAAELVASLPEATRLRRLLDLGGGPDVVGMAIVERCPDMTGVLCDLPTVAEVAREEIASRGLEGRMSVLAGDYNTLNLGQGFDLIWASHTLYYVRDMREFMARLLAALNPGGLFLSLHEGLTGERTGPAPCVLARLSLALEGQDVSSEAGQIARAMLEAGFQSLESRETRTPMGTMRLDVGRKAGTMPEPGA